MGHFNLIYPLKAMCKCSIHKKAVKLNVSLRTNVLQENKFSYTVLHLCPFCNTIHKFDMEKSEMHCGVAEIPLISNDRSKPLLEVKLLNNSSKIDWRCPHCGHWDYAYGSTDVTCESCGQMLPNIAHMVYYEDIRGERLDYHKNGTDSMT